MNKVFLAGALVVGTIVVIGALKPEEPKTAQSTGHYDCGLHRIYLYTADKKRREYNEKVLDAMHEGKAWHMQTQDDKQAEADWHERELKEGDEYLKHQECTEYVENIRDVIGGLRKIEADWQRVQADLKRVGRE